jgi:hypothetical protein
MSAVYCEVNMSEYKPEVVVHKIREPRRMHVKFTVILEPTNDLGTYVKWMKEKSRKETWTQQYLGEFLPGDAD